MSTALTIMRRALRTIGVLGAGQEPAGRDQADVLERLQGLILDMPGLYQNGRWTEEAVTADYEAEEGDRVTVTGSHTVTLPATVTDCRTGAARPPRDLAKVQVIGADATVVYGDTDDGTAGVYLYSASKGAWGRADALATSSELPFGSEDDEGLAAKLAVTILDEYGEAAKVGQMTAVKADAFWRSVRARLKKAEPADLDRPGEIGGGYLPSSSDYY